MDTTADMAESISTHQNVLQTQNLPVNAGRHDQVQLRSHVGMLNMRIDMHGAAYHMNTAEDMQGHVSTHAANPKPPDLPIGGRRLPPDKTDGLESCPGMQRVCTYMQSIGDSSNRPENMLVTLVLPANGAEPCTGRPKRPRDQTDVSDTCTCTQCVVSNSNIPANTSVISVTLNLPAGGTEPHTGGAKKA